MKSNRKALLLTLCAILLVLGTVVGSLAYFTDSEAVTNTFTVGNVAIELHEDGEVTRKDGTIGKDYHLLPGHSYSKDPTITVDADSSDCYLFVKVVNGIEAIETKVEADTVAAQMAAKGWKPVKDVANVYVYAVGEADKTAVAAGAEVKVFETFTIDGESVTNTVLAPYKDANVTVTAYAVQKAGFESSTPAEIWNAALKDLA